MYSLEAAGFRPNLHANQTIFLRNLVGHDVDHSQHLLTKNHPYISTFKRELMRNRLLMLTRFKNRIQSLLTLAAKAAHIIGLTPNMVSAMGLCLILLSAYAYSMGDLFFAPILLFFSGFCDVLDGIIARLYEVTTHFGAFLDSLMDRYGDSVVFAGMIIGGLCRVESGLAAVIGSLLVSYTRARAEAIGIKMESIGLGERAERLLILLVSSIIAISWPEALDLGVILVALLANFTVLQRSLYVYTKLKRN